MTGTMRDELAVSLPYPTTGNLTQYLEELAGLGLDARPLLALLPLLVPEGTKLDTAAAIFGLVVRIGTDVFFRCLDQALAYAAALRVGGPQPSFRNVWRYEFNRSYSPREFTTPWCDPPVVDGSADPESDEYYKCHAGSQLYEFGVLGRGGPARQPDRDGRDIPFSRWLLDSWAAFARAGDPNPDPAWLRARGFESTLERITAVGATWSPVLPPGDGPRAGEPTSRLWQWEARQVPFEDEAVCAVLGFGRDYYLRATY